MNYFDIDIYIQHFGKLEIAAKMYEYLKQHTPFFPFVCSAKWVCLLDVEDEKYYLCAFCTAINVVEKQIDTDTDIVRLKLAYYDGIAERQRVFDSSILSKFGVKELLNYGVRFEEAHAELVIQYLLKSELTAPIQRTFSKLGWIIDADRLLFKTHSAILEDGSIEKYKYSGNLDLQPCGNLQVWLGMVKQEVLPSIPMTIALVIGFASPLLSFLNQRHDLGSVWFNLNNTSSKGKSTAAMLAASVFSNPSMNKGTMVSYNATENAIIQFFSNCHGHTICIDEVGIIGSKDLSQLTYTVCNGRSKMRLNPDSSAKEIKEFSSFVISTAEMSVIPDTAPNGIRARVFELSDTLTLSADNSDRIKETVIRNYAVAGEEFIKAIITKTDRIEQDYLSARRSLLKNCKEIQELTERIFSKFAVLLVTAQYIEECFQLGIDVQAVLQYLTALERTVAVDAQPDDKLLDILSQEILKHRANFATDFHLPKGTCFGAIKELEDESFEVQIIETTFKKIMKENNIADYMQLLKLLKARHILISEKDRLYKRVIIAREVGKVKCFCFLFQAKAIESLKDILVKNVPHPKNDDMAQYTINKDDLQIP